MLSYLKNHDDSGRYNLATKTKKLLFEYGSGFAWISQEIGNPDLLIDLRLVDCYTQNWHIQSMLSFQKL
jgi:hypothetical protein